MNAERIKTTLEIYGIKARSIATMAIRLSAIAVILLGAYNLFAPTLAIEAIAVYPREQAILIDNGSGYFLEDIAVVVVGLIVGYLA